jgi:hypothetical protein
VVLEYREKECVVPWNINRRIQRVMHFQIPLRSFEATVRLPSPEHHEEEYQMFGTTTTTTGGEGICSSSSTSSSRKRQETTTTSSSSSLRPPPPHVVYTSASPRSIPVSPLARKRVQLAFSNFSDDILFQARDRLRQERIATLTGEQHLQIPRFNVQDCHEEIYLSCGRHCATKVGTGMYRSVRSTVSIETKRFVYFEMALKDLTQQKLKNKTTTNSIQEKQSTSFSVGTFKQFTTSSEVTSIETSSACSTNITNEMSVCVGLSTRTMPVNALVGTSRHSIGFYSGGRVLVGSQRRSFVSVENTFGIGNVVGVLVYIEKKISTNMANAIVRFSVDGKALRDRTGHVLVFSFPIPFEAELFPTLTLHSQGVQVFGRFSVPDVTGILQLEEFDLVTSKEQKDHTHGGIIDVWCLDGLRMNVFSSSQDGSFDDLKEKDKEENKTP